MPAVIDVPGGGSGGAPAPSSTYPAVIRQAISFTLLDGSGTTVSLPRNPTDPDDDQQMIAVDRPTADGNLTYLWQPDVEHITLTGFTREEGVGFWYDFKARFLGQVCRYTNLLTGQRLTVLVDRVRIFTSQKPATYRWTIAMRSA